MIILPAIVGVIIVSVVGGNVWQPFFDWEYWIIFQIRDGLYYNPYFPGGAIAMPQMLVEGAVEYEDETPATESQVGWPFLFRIFLVITSLYTHTCMKMYARYDVFHSVLRYFEIYNARNSLLMMQMAKDVVSFLSWAAEPEMEERKLVGSD